MKKLIIAAVVASGVFSHSGIAHATSPQITIPVNSVVRGQAGSEHVLAEETVDEIYRTMICTVIATAKNQGSVHPNNDLYINSGTDSVVLSDVERESNVLTTANKELKMDEKLTVTLKLGQDKVFSGGLDVKLTCKEEPKTKVCRNGEEAEVKESEVLDTDTELPCPIPEEPKEEPKVLTRATELPKTGAGSIVGAFTSIAAIGSIAHAVVTRRR